MPRNERNSVTDALRDRIVGDLHVGRLLGGERLESLRVLATRFGVNERVVMAAMRTLAEEGFIVLRPRSGAFVARPHPGSGAGTLPDLGAWLVSVLAQARARGIAPRDLSEYARRAMETRRLHAACIECNRDQVHLLCSELAHDVGFVTHAMDVADLVDSDVPLALRRADVLVTTRYHAVEVQAAAERLGKPWIVVALRPDVLNTVEERLLHGLVYYVATDTRYEAKLRGMLSAATPLENLRVLIVDRDDLDAIPHDAPTFVMTSAREEVTRRYGTRGIGRPIHPPRHLSDEAVRALLTFLVRANMAALATPLR